MYKKNSKYFVILTLFKQLLANLDVQEELHSVDEKGSEWLPPVLNALFEDEEIQEESMENAIFNSGNICAPEVANILDIYRTSTVSDVERTIECPFREVDGRFYSTADTLLMDPISNDWKLTECSLWVFPLKKEKIAEYRMLAPLSKFVAPWWAGVSNVLLGDLLPPYHPVLIFRMECEGVVKWMAFDCGQKGIGVVAKSGRGYEHSPPKEDLLGKENGSQAKCVRYFARVKSHWGKQLTLYDFLRYGVQNSEPISLKWHLNKYKDDVIKAVTSYCSTTCWGFVNGALDMFTEFQLTPEVLAELDFKPPEALEISL